MAHRWSPPSMPHDSFVSASRPSCIARAKETTLLTRCPVRMMQARRGRATAHRRDSALRTRYMALPCSACSMARSASRIGERFAGHRYELPGVGAIIECELEDAVVPRAQLAVGDRRAQGIGARPPRPDHEFPDAERRAKRAVRGPARRPVGLITVARASDLHDVPRR